jgi:hypothetical protein
MPVLLQLYLYLRSIYNGHCDDKERPDLCYWHARGGFQGEGHAHHDTIITAFVRLKGFRCLSPSLLNVESK